MSLSDVLARLKVLKARIGMRQITPEMEADYQDLREVIDALEALAP